MTAEPEDVLDESREPSIDAIDRHHAPAEELISGEDIERCCSHRHCKLPSRFSTSSYSNDAQRSQPARDGSQRWLLDSRRS